MVVDLREPKSAIFISLARVICQWVFVPVGLSVQQVASTLWPKIVDILNSQQDLQKFVDVLDWLGWLVDI